MNDFASNSQIAQSNAEYYDHRWESHGRGLSKQRALRMNFIVNALFEVSAQHAFRPLKILDIGCGNGWMAPFLHPFGPVTGVDFAPSAIESARALYAYCGDFVVAEADSPRLGIPDDVQFDVVVCSEVIEHAVDHQLFVKQLKSFLLPSGTCILTTPNGNLWKWYQRDSQQHLQPVENWLTPHQLRKLFEQTGFKVVKHTGGIFPGYRRGVWGGFLQHKIVIGIFHYAGLKDFYAQALLQMAFYQLMVVEKGNAVGL